MNIFMHNSTACSDVILLAVESRSHGSGTYLCHPVDHNCFNNRSGCANQKNAFANKKMNQCFTHTDHQSTRIDDSVENR